MNRAALASLTLAAALAGCVSPSRDVDTDRRPEFVGRAIEVQTANNQSSTLRFDADGTVRAQFGTQQMEGRWNLQRGQLCFTWAGNYRECWPYARPFRVGRTVPLTSDRGNAIRVTLR
jgi:hypothetical protein